MSCQRGNTKRVRPQKYKNVTAFKNDLHDCSKRTKMIKEKEIAEVRNMKWSNLVWDVWNYNIYFILTSPLILDSILPH